MTFPRPIAHYRLNGIPDDYSGNGHNGTWAAAEAYEEDNHGKTVGLFNGSTSYLNCGNILDINVGTGDFTIVAWVRLKTVGVTNAICSKKKWSDDFVYTINYSNVQKLWIDRVASLSNTPLTLNKWYMCTVVRASGVITFYLDKDPDGGGTADGSIDNANDMTIGSDNIITSIMDGNIGELRLYNCALSAAQVKALYQQPELAYVPIDCSSDDSLILSVNDGLKDNSKNGIALTRTNCVPGNGKMVFTNGGLAFAAQTFTSYEYSYKASDRYIHYFYDGTNTYTNGVIAGSMPVSIGATGFSGATGSMKDIRLYNTVKASGFVSLRYKKARRFW